MEVTVVQAAVVVLESERVDVDGRGNAKDVRAGLNWIEGEFHPPIPFACLSFGLNSGLRTCCGDRCVHDIVSLAIPREAERRGYRSSFLRGSTGPKIFASIAEEQYAPAAALRAIGGAAAPPAELALIMAAHHFLAGRLKAMQVVIRTWLNGDLLSFQAQCQKAQ